MASAVADRAWRRSTPERIEPDLAALWRDLAQADQPIARAVMSNLVVVCHPTDDAGAGVEGITAALGLDEVAARHPSRLIVLEHEPGRSNPDAPFAAGVGIITFGSPHARYRVELIMVRSACAEASLLATRDQAAGPAPEIEESQDDDAVLSVVIRHGTGEATATLTSRGVVVADGSTAPFVVGVPIEGEGDAVAAELRTLSHDTRLDDAINALARWFGAA